MEKIKAIQTAYKGYRFRSRLEARWAVFFDALNLSWQYEPEGFELGGGVRYLPDFYLPKWDIYLEVKPKLPDDDLIEVADGKKAVSVFRDGKATDMGKFVMAWMALERKEGNISKPRIYLLCGYPGVPKIEHESGWIRLRDGAVALSFIPVPEPDGPLFPVHAFCESSGTLDMNAYYPGGARDGTQEVENPFWPCNCSTNLYIGKGRCYDSKLLMSAYAAARSARFEHGETPS